MAATQEISQRDDEIDLGELLGTLIDHKWLILIVTGLFLVVSVVYVLFATPIYEANSMVQVEQKVPNLPGLAAITQTLGADNSEATTEIALITSRSVVGKAVSDLNLEIVAEPRHFPLFGSSTARHFGKTHPGELAAPMLGMSSYDWGGAELNVSQLSVPDTMEGVPLKLIAGENSSYSVQDDDGNLLLRGMVGQLAQGRGVTIQVKALRANPGTQFHLEHDRTLAVISQLQLDITATEQGKDSGIIGLTYDNKDPVLATALLDEVGTWYVRQNIARNAEEAANSLKFVKEQLPNVQSELDKAQAAMNVFQNQARSVDINMQTKGLLDQVVAVESSIQQLRLQQVDAQRRFTPDHPAYKALLDQIAQLESQKTGLEKQVDNLPDTQRQLLRLSRDVQVNTATYTSLMAQAQQLDIARAGTVGNVRVIDTAAVDITKPVKPKKALVVLGGTFLGAFLVIGFIYLRQALNRGVEDPSEIEQLGLSVYASIPSSNAESVTTIRRKHLHGDGKQHLLVLDAPADPATEALRSLRTSLHFARLEAKNHVLMISGSSPEAGKTFISSNLAAVIAQSGQKVLLIDGDLRKGTVHRVVGGRPENGLSELIAGQIDLAVATRPVSGLENLHFIARGKVPPNPSELLMNARFTTLLNQVMPLYDLIIIDTPPILAVTDAAIIGNQVGTSLLVVRFGLNQSREIALAKQRFSQNGVDLKGAIFNAVEKRSSGYYSYGYYEYKTTN